VVEQKRYQRLAGTKEIVIVSISTNVKGHNTSKALDLFWIQFSHASSICICSCKVSTVHYNKMF
jgi:hypothetical protein